MNGHAREPHGPTRRASLGGATALLGLTAMAACGTTTGGATPADGQRTQQPVTLRLNYRAERYIPERAKAFTAANPRITVDLVPDSGYEKLVALLAAGDLGDMIWASTGVGTYFELASQGHFLNLEPIVARDKFDLKQFFPRAVDTAKLVENRLLGLPNLIHPSHIGLFYNVNMFDAAGVKPPSLTWSVDDLTDAARRLTGGSGEGGRPAQWGVLTETSYPALVVFLRTFGGEIMDPPTLGKKAAIDRAPAKQAFQWLYDLRQKHRAHPLQGVDKASFADGNVAMMTTGMWGMTTASQIGDRFRMDATLVPKGPTGKRGSQGHVDMWALYDKSKHKDEAWLLMKHFTSREQGPFLLQEHGNPGARPDAWSDAVAMAPAMFKVFKDFMDKEGPGPLAVPYNFRMLEIGQVATKALDPMWTGQQSPDQVIAAASGQFQALLDQPRPK